MHAETNLGSGAHGDTLIPVPHSGSIFIGLIAFIGVVVAFAILIVLLIVFFIVLLIALMLLLILVFVLALRVLWVFVVLGPLTLFDRGQ
jgi:hypothetical protein